MLCHNHLSQDEGGANSLGWQEGWQLPPSSPKGRVFTVVCSRHSVSLWSRGRLLVAHRKGLGDPGLGVGPLERKPPWDLGVGAEAGMDLRLPVVLGVAGPLTLSLDALSSASFPGTVPG